MVVTLRSGNTSITKLCVSGEDLLTLPGGERRGGERGEGEGGGEARGGEGRRERRGEGREGGGEGKGGREGKGGGRGGGEGGGREGGRRREGKGGRRGGRRGGEEGRGAVTKVCECNTCAHFRDPRGTEGLHFFHRMHWKVSMVHIYTNP